MRGPPASSRKLSLLLSQCKALVTRDPERSCSGNKIPRSECRLPPVGSRSLSSQSEDILLPLPPAQQVLFLPMGRAGPGRAGLDGGSERRGSPARERDMIARGIRAGRGGGGRGPPSTLAVRGVAGRGGAGRRGELVACAPCDKRNAP